MSFKINKKLVVPPIVAGGIYEKQNQDGTITRGICMTWTERQDGLKQGLLSVYNYPDEPVMESTESLLGWDLVAVPKELEERIKSELRLSEVDELRRTNARLQAELAAAGRTGNI